MGWPRPGNDIAVEPATAADAPAVAALVAEAYAKYIPRIGREPGPMLEDYPARIAEGAVWVARDGERLAGILVLLDRPGYLLLDNVAVSGAAQGRGVGRALMAFAEAEACRRGYREVRLYTHQTMTENIAMYPRLGYQETGRGIEDGYARVFFGKPLGRP